MDDTVITTKVKAATFNEPSPKPAEINVETLKGAVRLSGVVNSRADINKAVEVARGVADVTSVKKTSVSSDVEVTSMLPGLLHRVACEL